MGSIVLPHLPSGWHVDQAILSEEDRLVVIRFGKDGNPDCMRQDDVLARIADVVKNFAVIYLCDNEEVPDFNAMYELYDPMTIMVCPLGPPPRVYHSPRCEDGVPLLTSAFPVVLLPQQANNVRLRNRKQQQAELGVGRQAGAHRHHRDNISRGEEGTWSGCQPEGLLDQISVLEEQEQKTLKMRVERRYPWDLWSPALAGALAGATGFRMASL